jgi:hypothetical protein
MLAVMGAAKKLEADPALYRQTLEHEFKLPPALIKAMPIALHTVNFEALPADYQPLIDGLAQVGALAKSFPASQMVFQVKP